MATDLPSRLDFDIDHEVVYGAVDEVGPRLRRVTAENPGKFTFRGTGTYIVGRESVAVIDPGPDDDAHVEALLAAVEGETVTHVLITHTHRDHSPASASLVAATGAVTCGFGPHPDSPPLPGLVESLAREKAEAEADGDDEADEGDEQEEPGDTAFEPDVTLRHGDVVEGPGWQFEALHTPGHISNHLCYALTPGDGDAGGLFPGDHVMGWSTTIIPPPDGDLAAYLASLRLLLERDDPVYWPTHGPPIVDPLPYVRGLLAHRMARTDQIRACLAHGPATIKEMVAVMYADTPVELHKPAAFSVLSHMLHLLDTGEVTSEGDPGLDNPFSLA